MIIMVMSALTVMDVAEYLRLDEATDPLLPGILEASKNYVVTLTGRSVEILDEYPDIALAVLVLCQDMYDNRVMYVDKNSVNKVIESILYRYRTNLV